MINKDKIFSRKNILLEIPLKKSFDFSAVASDILNNKGTSNKYNKYIVSKSQNKLKMLVKK